VITVVGEAPCSGVTVESDPYVPLTVTWQVPRSGQPLYLRVSGTAGGELEFKIDPVSGALLEAIVIDSPPATSGVPALPAPDPAADATPVVDRSPWELGDPPDPHLPAHRVISTRSAVGMATAGDLTAVVVSAEPVVRSVGCGPVRVGIAAGGELVAVVSARGASGDASG
jgi:hypothetical protein